MSKIAIIVSATLVALLFAFFRWYLNADLIVKEHKSIDYLESRGWITLDVKFFEGSSVIKSAADLDSNDYIISIGLNKKQIDNLYSYLVELKCKKYEVSSKKIESLTDHQVEDYPIVAFLHGRDCGVQGEWILDRKKGMAISTSTFPFDSRVLRAYRKKFL